MVARALDQAFPFVEFSFVPGSRVRSFVVRLVGSPLDVVLVESAVLSLSSLVNGVPACIGRLVIFLQS